MEFPRVGATERFIRTLRSSIQLSARLGRRREAMIRFGPPRWSPEPREGNARRLHGLRSTAAKMTSYRHMDRIPVVTVHGCPTATSGCTRRFGWTTLPVASQAKTWVCDGVQTRERYFPCPYPVRTMRTFVHLAQRGVFVASWCFRRRACSREGDDPGTHAIARLRAEALRQRSEDAMRHATVLRARSDEAVEERKRDRFAMAADIASEQARAASATAEQLETMDHSIAWVCA